MISVTHDMRQERARHLKLTIIKQIRAIRVGHQHFFFFFQVFLTFASSRYLHLSPSGWAEEGESARRRSEGLNNKQSSSQEDVVFGSMSLRESLVRLCSSLFSSGACSIYAIWSHSINYLRRPFSCKLVLCIFDQLSTPFYYALRRKSLMMNFN